MSSCLSGGGRTYALDLEIIKSPSSSTRTSHTSSSPSSTLSESSNSPLAISTRKPRTPRKRPNQTYNEAAALLSTAYPNIFSSKNLTKPRKFTKPQDSFFNESSELLLPFRVIDDSGFLLQNQPIREKPSCLIEPKVVNFCDKSWQSSSGEVNSHGGGGSTEMGFSTEFQEDFDAESILDEEIEEGIDSIMGNLSVNQETLDESNGTCHGAQISQIGSWYGNPMGLGFGGRFEFGFGFGLRRGVRALRHVDEGNWWNFSTVDVLQISPKTKTKVSRAEKKKKRVEKPIVVTEAKGSDMPKENPKPNPIAGLQLKLNYDEVVNAWSDRGSPFAEESPGAEVAGNDVYARLAQIDLFSDGGGVREASVLRYKEKRRTRLFSKKIRYQVRKVNADRRPRMKGRFVRRPNSGER
ncbi:LOW QUALITY PROTEIN: protein CHLOROPLAST IMPORT APPARATUS 2 [Herrania umbratica]|uniref:LOW QUALITY PROTEIN: protein CHLOROPLAST IMPORT APPARATUS 2 n=1 Tax=Herrania umbratica TaxID=108875 RepID=A0A6J0ZSB5_9ROSI|nr:LOW QUALITY PROTEIN: protein CHLOROPLAST IMPORT APPARATUS 2 [Herrania umbratica]